MSKWGIKASMPRGKTHMDRYVAFVVFYYAHTFLRCFLVDVTCSASAIWPLQSSNINYPFDGTKGHDGVDCEQMFLVEHSNISPMRRI